MGDVAILSPVLHAILEKNSHVEITVLTQQFFAPIFKNLKNVKVHTVATKGIHKGFTGLYRLYKELKPYKFTAIVDVHNVHRSNILKLFFFGKKFLQIDKGRKEKNKLIAKQNFIQLKTTHERYADVFRKLGLQLDLSNPKFPKAKKLPNFVIKLVKEYSNLKIIGIAPFAAHKSKMYSLEKMKVVVEELSKKHLVFLFGGKSDAKILDNFQTNKHIHSLAGKLPFSDELDTISNLDCMLSMDSGNAHLAAMYGVKVITIWGVTHPFTGFAPFNQPKDFCLLPNLLNFPKIPTSIYGNKYPEGYENAASSISTDTIIKKVESII